MTGTGRMGFDLIIYLANRNQFLRNKLKGKVVAGNEADKSVETIARPCPVYPVPGERVGSDVVSEKRGKNGKNSI